MKKNLIISQTLDGRVLISTTGKMPVEILPDELAFAIAALQEAQQFGQLETTKQEPTH